MVMLIFHDHSDDQLQQKMVFFCNERRNLESLKKATIEDMPQWYKYIKMRMLHFQR